MQALIDQWKQGAKAQMHQYLASIGARGPETLKAIDRQIDAEGVQMAARMLENEIAQGTGALTGAAGALTGAGNVCGQRGSTRRGTDGGPRTIDFRGEPTTGGRDGGGGVISTLLAEVALAEALWNDPRTKPLIAQGVAHEVSAGPPIIRQFIPAPPWREYNLSA